MYDNINEDMDDEFMKEIMKAKKQQRLKSQKVLLLKKYVEN